MGEDCKKLKWIYPIYAVVIYTPNHPKNYALQRNPKYYERT